MSTHTCRFCGKNQDIFTIEVPAEDEKGEHSEFHVCGGCWEVIAEIAKRVVIYATKQCAIYMEEK